MLGEKQPFNLNKPPLYLELIIYVRNFLKLLEIDKTYCLVLKNIYYQTQGDKI